MRWLLNIDGQIETYKGEFMASTTSKYKLRKPAMTDNVNVTTDISDNMDKVDTLAFMNRVDVNATQPTVYWAGSTQNDNAVLHIDSPTVFAVPPQLSAITNRGVNTFQTGYWYPLISCKAPNANNVTFNGMFLYSTTSYSWSPYTGIGMVSGVESGSSVLGRLTWLGGNLNVNDFALCKEMRYESGQWVEYYVVYAKKLSTTYASVVVILSQWSNSTAGTVSRLWLDATDRPGRESIEPTDAPANPSEGTVYIYKRYLSTAGTLTTDS